jgi:hypothetical protein
MACAARRAKKGSGTVWDESGKNKNKRELPCSRVLRVAIRDR